MRREAGRPAASRMEAVPTRTAGRSCRSLLLRTHTHTHSITHTHRLTHAQARARAIHIYTNAPTHTRLSLKKQTHSSLTDTRTHSLILSLSLSPSLPPSLSLTCTQMHVHVHINMHICTRTPLPHPPPPFEHPRCPSSAPPRGLSQSAADPAVLGLENRRLPRCTVTCEMCSQRAAPVDRNDQKQSQRASERLARPVMAGPARPRPGGGDA